MFCISVSLFCSAFPKKATVVVPLECVNDYMSVLCVNLVLTCTISHCSSTTGLHFHRHVVQQQHPGTGQPARGLGTWRSVGGGQYWLLNASGRGVHHLALFYLHRQPGESTRWENHQPTVCFYNALMLLEKHFYQCNLIRLIRHLTTDNVSSKLLFSILTYCI